MANFSLVLSCMVFGVLTGSTDAMLHADAGKKGDGRKSLIVQQQTVEQQLIICNGYTSKVPLEIVHVRTQTKLNAKPLAYKNCLQSSVPLAEGDQLDFKAGHSEVGTFYTTGLPQYKSSLLLVAHRRSPHAVGLRFESHAFAHVGSPQIAVIDASLTKHGSGDGIKISESLLATGATKGEAPVEEHLRFNSVVAVNPGDYQISLAEGISNSAKTSLNAADAGKYVVLRVGGDPAAAPTSEYPQELVLFQSGSRYLSFSLIAFVTTIVLAISGY
jgi:hypothetical protein